MKHLFLFLIVFFSFQFISAQEISPCGQWENRERIFEQHPEQRELARKSSEELERFTAEFIKNKGGDDEVYIIPIVYHVIYQTDASNISDEQIYSSVEALNRDFRLENDDYMNAPEQFANIAADIEIEFRLAKIDPQGNCTKGINRIESALTYEGGSDMKELSYWPRNKYLNIWVCSEAGGAAGYTNYPSTVDSPFMADQDGIVLLHTYTGAIGTSTASHARTLSHECGHWLNLAHVWGSSNNPELDDNCFMDDNVSDTPLTIGHSGTCNQTLESCGSLDNINNYMEYSSCKYMFTEGQRSRMRAAIVSSTAQRNQLWQNSNLINTGVNDDSEELCQADFSSELQNGCLSKEFFFEDESFHGILTRIWDFGDGTTYETSDPEESIASHIYSSPGIYDVSLTVSDGVSTISETKTNFISVYDPEYIGEVLLEDFENGVDAMIWTISNPDDDYTWETTDNTAFTGSTSLRIRNRNINLENAKDYLESSVMDFTGNDAIYLSYSWAFALRQGDVTDDRLKVSISYNCGESWILKKLHRGTTDLPTIENPVSGTFTPGFNSDEWETNTITIDNPNQITADFQVKFDFTARGGNNIYLDKINIIGSNSVDISEIDLESNFVITPNPASNFVNISFTNITHSSSSKLAMYDVSGRLIALLANNTLLKGNSVDIDISKFPTGLYFINYSNAEGDKIVEKLIIN